MLHARHHFLADIAAFGEIDTAELIHVGLVRKGVAVAEIRAAARNAERDAVRLVFARGDQRGAEFGCRIGERGAAAASRAGPARGRRGSA